jgi:hypothetical protein
MSAAPLIPPDPFGIPAAPVVFVVLNIVTMFLHIVCMNVVLGGGVISVVLDGLTLLKRGNHHHTVRVLWQIIPVALSLTITTGVAPLLFVQVMYGHFFYASTIFMGFVWFAIVPVLILTFYLAYTLSYRLGSVVSNRMGAWNHSPARRLMLSIPVSLLVVFVAWVLVNNHNLSLLPQQWPQDGVWKQNRWLVAPDVTIPRYLHVIFGAVAVGGAALVAIGWWRQWRGADTAQIAETIRRPGLWACAISLLGAITFGVLYSLVLPGDVQRAALRPADLLSWLWTVGVLAALAQAVCLFMALRPGSDARWQLGLVAGVCVTLVGMMCGRESVRNAYLAAAGFSVCDWTVYWQQSSFTLFVVMLAGAAITIAWLVRISMRAPDHPELSAERSPHVAPSSPDVEAAAGESDQNEPRGP